MFLHVLLAGEGDFLFFSQLAENSSSAANTYNTEGNTGRNRKRGRKNKTKQKKKTNTKNKIKENGIERENEKESEQLLFPV